MVPKEITDWITENGFGKLLRINPVGGGCINNGARLETDTGISFFLKTNHAAPADLFAREAEGLQALSVMHAPRVPKVHLFDRYFLLLEDLKPALRCNHYWELLGSQLAVLHNQISDRFGFQHDNYIGSTPQPNPWYANGYDFFAQQRLQFQSSLAFEHGLLEKKHLRQVERLELSLASLIPDQPASLIHGDLWSGNIISDKQGCPALIDPAVYYGWAEAELAMTDLFGKLPEQFYESYQTVRPLEPGYRQRFPLYNLYHLLNHLNIFGRGYLACVKEVLDRFS